MKKILLFVFLVLCGVFFIAFVNDNDKPTFIPASQQRSGDSAKGFEYLKTGDVLKSGIPYSVFILAYGKDQYNYLRRSGKNANVPFGYNVVKSGNGVEVVIPTCMQCHAQVFNDSLVVGMGNTFIDFSNFQSQAAVATNERLNLLKAFSPRQHEAIMDFLRIAKTVYPKLETEVRGVNVADGLAAILAAHRDPQTLIWSDTALLQLPAQNVPTDVPAWWLLKKKNAMFYNGFGRGDFGKFLMASNLLTVKDSAEANEVNTHFGDVLAYIKTIEAPKYPKAINEALAQKGKAIFTNTCSKCHGTYGDKETYPNLLVPASIIQTDSALYKANQQNPQFINWFNTSWFAQGQYPARLEPSVGYVAPPLNGIWATAPYFHNGSVPDLESVINSKARPAFWFRDFNKPEYNYDNPGWKFLPKESAEGKKNYNTTLPGYGNYGHYFGDKLSDKDRKAVVEYLKKL